MWADLALSGATSALKQGLGYAAASAKAKADRQWQAYKNAMTKLANANNQNAITTNEVLLEERVANQRFNIERSAYITTGQAEASAAATGTSGRSVDMLVFDIERNASMHQANITSDLEAQYIQHDEQRKNSAFQAAMQQDYTYIPSPMAATYVLGFGTDLTNAYTKLNKGT
jgi:hypothetical protein